jgi:hypothetical protein
MFKEIDPEYKILLIASEILIPVIIFVGAYFIFKPFIKKNKELSDDEE